MKFRSLIAAVLFLAGCANQRPAGLSDSRTTESYNRDLSACEREATFAGAGSKGQAFDNCMKTKGYTPKR
jgi:uncharacterized lipoprotein NlpE involved in copper resistance